MKSLNNKQGCIEDTHTADVIAAMTFENMDVFVERPWMGLPRVIEVISLSIDT
ncbi:hypothetical protein K8B83_18580 [Shewanella inventionis]|uniref:hypothetical protein n=1 Tax=Shewanella inventionis TaxID=1738770 RepID=UPI001667C957|nr:hypothetical protein [Shewanella inventionis]MCL1158262.1 hypothetical protein [Shewanella inventionis]UAL42801.1 hypothetical protein K8B83_18580 [Shewanella inventionis]